MTYARPPYPHSIGLQTHLINKISWSTPGWLIFYALVVALVVALDLKPRSFVSWAGEWVLSAKVMVVGGAARGRFLGFAEASDTLMSASVTFEVSLRASALCFLAGELVSSTKVFVIGGVV